MGCEGSNYGSVSIAGVLSFRRGKKLLVVGTLSIFLAFVLMYGTASPTDRKIWQQMRKDELEAGNRLTEEDVSFRARSGAAAVF